MKGSKQRRMGGLSRISWSRAILAALCIVLVSALGAEFAARTLFDLDTLQYRRTYQPIFVSGDSHYLMPNDQLPFTVGGPVALGYKPVRFGFEYDPATAPPRTSTGFGDFLFSHTKARYSAQDADRISCEQQDAKLVYVLGGSVAQGFSAESKDDTWHAVLEGLLRRRLGRQDLYVFNAAMGGFVSLQERLAYTVAVMPRRADLVLLVDGYNDVAIPANSGVRPGDPFQLGLRYSQLFDDGFMWWLARHSAIAHTILQNGFTEHVANYRRQLEQDEALFQRHAEAVADIYMENTTAMLETCTARGQACLVGIQPARSLTAHYLGTQVDDILSQKRMVAMYRLILDKVSAAPQRQRFIDLTHVFDRGEKLQHYADPVHPNYAGQQVLARALLEPVLDALRTAKPVPATSDRCDRLK
jgi:lysophospholipase L1-like esterase